MPNYERAFAARPDVYSAWQQLNASIKANMDLRRYELVTLAAARRMKSSYCMLAHGGVLMREFLSEDELRAAATDHRTAGLSGTDIAVMDLAEKIVDDATQVTEADTDRLRALGLSDDDILDVVLAATARCFFSKTLDALGVQPDAHYAQLAPELREALVVGRPISPAPAA